jgi:hypothetical protein
MGCASPEPGDDILSLRPIDWAATVRARLDLSVARPVVHSAGGFTGAV